MNKQANFRSLTPIMPPWISSITADTDLLGKTIAEYGSPVNRRVSINVRAGGFTVEGKQLHTRFG